MVLEESTFQLSGSKVPTFKILKSDLYLKKQSAIFEKLASQYNSSEVDYLYSIWTLCAALWGPNENTVASRRFLLSEWLKSTCATDDLTLKTGPYKSVAEATESIFTHLSIFKVNFAYVFLGKLSFEGFLGLGCCGYCDGRKTAKFVPAGSSA